MFFGINEIAVKVPSIFKLLIKEVGSFFFFNEQKCVSLRVILSTVIFRLVFK